MTEPPKVEERPCGNERCLCREGWCFDLGSHAVPLLIPFFDLAKGIRLRDVWAGRCDELRDVIYSGAETFSIADVECCTRETGTKRSSGFIRGGS